MFLDRLWQDLRFRFQPSYQPVQPSDDEAQTQPTAALLQSIVPKGRKRIVAIVALVTIFLFALLTKSPTNVDIRPLKKLKHRNEPAAGYLHIIVPASAANLKYCRTSLSAAQLGYPVPEVVNWEDEHSGREYGAAAGEWGRFLGTLKFLESKDKWRANDLVLVIDAADSWFQLRPDVLVKRYREVNKDAEHRAEKQLGKAANKRSIQQDVIFTAQRKCHAMDKAHVSCYAAPQSPLSVSKYGFTPSEEDSSSVVDSHPRYLNAGMMMGSAGAMLKLHLAAYARWEKQFDAYDSRQAIFSEIFGRQEYQRELIRVSQKQGKSWFGSSTESSYLRAHPPTEHPGILSTDSYHDHGISLDYSSSLAAISTPSTSAWIGFSDSKSITRAVADLSPPTTGPTTLQKDIASSRPPFWSLAAVQKVDNAAFPREMSWAAMSLYTNLYTGVSPVMILHDHGMEPAEMSKRWKSMWFHHYIRKKLTILAHEPIYPVYSERALIEPPPLTTNHDERGKLVDKTWWNPVYVTPVDKARTGFGFIVKGGAWKRWADECEKLDQEEMIGDGKGKWKDEKVYPPFIEGELDGYAVA